LKDFGESTPMSQKILVRDLNMILALKEKRMDIYIQDPLRELVDDIISN
jgi:hypothetical protein